jgi:anti-sigma B factor antagonist
MYGPYRFTPAHRLHNAYTGTPRADASNGAMDTIPGLAPFTGAEDGGEQPWRKRLVIQVRHHPGHVLVTVAGEVDISTVGQLRERLAGLAAAGRPLVTDLDQVTFIDAAGLGALVGAARRAAAHGTSLRVVCSRAQTRNLLQLTGLDRCLGLSRTPEGAYLRA